MNPQNSLKLREYQSDLILKARQAFRISRGVLLQLPTGGGKTIIFTFIAAAAYSKGKKVLVLAHREELIIQASAKFQQAGISHGIYSAGYESTINEQIQIASVNTLCARLKKYISIYGEPDLIIIDEAHHSAATQWQKIIKAFPNAKILGVTATPERSDGKGLGTQSGCFYDTMINGPSTKWLVSQGYLSPPKVYAPENKSEKAIIAGDIIKNWKLYSGESPTVAFCASVKHAEEIAHLFNSFNIPAASVDGTMDRDIRKKNIESLANGSIKVLTSCNVISEGVDIPAIGCVLLLRRTTSVAMYLQQVGRALRPSEGKPFAIVIDHVGNTLMHGLVTDDWDWSLFGKNDRKRADIQEETIKVIQCKTCYHAYRPINNSRCPACGTPSQSKKPKKLAYNANQLLREIGEGDVKKVIEENKRDYKMKIAKAATLNELKVLAKELNYNEGWAFKIWQMRQAKIKIKKPKIFPDDF